LARKVEVYIMDNYSADIYARTIDVQFVAPIRSEIQFSGIAELVAAIERDVSDIALSLPVVD
jgi:FAD synthase